MKAERDDGTVLDCQYAIERLGPGRDDGLPTVVSLTAAHDSGGRPVKLEWGEQQRIEWQIAGTVDSVVGMMLG